MNQAKTTDSFSLLGPDKKPVPGKGTWLDARTFSFKPDSKLQPSTAYKAIFSTDATATDGTSPQAAIELDFQSVDALAVGQTFPATDAEDIDPTTTVTVIFNRPVVPLQFKKNNPICRSRSRFRPQQTGRENGSTLRCMSSSQRNLY